MKTANNGQKPVSGQCRIRVGLVSDSADLELLTVTEMAQAVGYSRDQFYELKRAGVFPEPGYRVSGRPYYDQLQLEICQKVLATGIGVHGQPVQLRKKALPPAEHDLLLKQLRHLGVTADHDSIHKAIAALPPTGMLQDRGQYLAALIREIDR